MSINWKSLWSEALRAADNIIKAKAPSARATLRSVARARERRLKLLLMALADGALDKQAIDDELADEEAILAAEFCAINLLAKRTAQDAANALISTIKGAMLKGVDLVA